MTIVLGHFFRPAFHTPVRYIAPYTWFCLKGDLHIGQIIDSREYYKLKNRVAKLEGMLEILKTACGVEDMPLDEKLSILDKFYEMRKYSVHMMCEALDVPRGTFYNHMKRGKKGNTVAARRREEMRHKILEIFYDSNQIFGAPKITAVKSCST